MLYELNIIGPGLHWPHDLLVSSIKYSVMHPHRDNDKNATFFD